MSTIAAIATGPAAGGIGIIRLSGPAALTAARRVARALPQELTPRHAYFTRFRDASGAVLDEGLALFFPGPHSFTGEDVIELHAHGAPRLLSLLLAELLREPGVRLATPGEFTRRAFLSGRIELSRAEAVAELVAAESEAQVRAAAAQLTGELNARLEAVHAPLLELQADLEGSLDFPEEAEGADADAGSRLDEALGAVRALLADARRGALIRRGARVVLYGPVNAGKSTLFNALAGAARALVDPEPGTTRDTLEARLELDGLALTLVDTAGLRDDAGRLEAMGIARTREALVGADLAVLVLPHDATADQRAAWRAECDDARRVEVWAKADLHPPHDGRPGVSGLTGLGLDELRQHLAARLGAGEASAVLATSERHLAALELVEGALTRARAALEVSTLEVVAGEVGLALHALAEVTGEDVSEALLDSIFARFCIGK
ncbi:MAG: tRNA uridine-5-carboxymethylaminomethyl(34) synthesis GTPase MnmE [Archangium sp.]|nr:tRNA uridine-5-carboxymethylaminomethyl(34) synthesis GTPase MnmE [Archangium sp.]